MHKIVETMCVCVCVCVYMHVKSYILKQKYDH